MNKRFSSGSANYEQSFDSNDDHVKLLKTLFTLPIGETYNVICTGLKTAVLNYGNH
jgi:hypothetical protein